MVTRTSKNNSIKTTPVKSKKQKSGFMRRTGYPLLAGGMIALMSIGGAAACKQPTDTEPTLTTNFGYTFGSRNVLIKVEKAGLNQDQINAIKNEIIGYLNSDMFAICFSQLYGNGSDFTIIVNDTSSYDTSTTTINISSDNIYIDLYDMMDYLSHDPSLTKQFDASKDLERFSHRRSFLAQLREFDITEHG